MNVTEKSLRLALVLAFDGGYLSAFYNEKPDPKNPKTSDRTRTINTLLANLKQEENK